MKVGTPLEKAGNIKRITGALDPRGYQVIPVAAPKPYELARHYLWRFWQNLPNADTSSCLTALGMEG